jgi:hypothetical protein
MHSPSSGPEHAVLTADVVRQSATSTPLAGALSSLPALPTVPALSSLPTSGLTSGLTSATKPVQTKLLADVTPGHRHIRHELQLAARHGRRCGAGRRGRPGGGRPNLPDSFRTRLSAR